MTTPDFKRKLSAIFMADVVGYSRLMGEDEAATLKTLNIYQGIMEGLIKQHRGRIVDAPGDAVLAEFSSVVDAVQCAVAVQKELEARNAELPENRRMQFRIGINLGDVIEEGEKIYGDGVNIAARLEALADPGGVCVSKTAFDHIETKLPLGYEFLGEKAVKNIAKPVKAYRVLLEPRVTVAGEIPKEKTQTAWPTKALVAAGLLMFIAGISLVIWKSGWLSAPPEKQAAPPSIPSPSPPPTQVAPLPPASPSPQALAPKKVAPVPKRADRPPVAPVLKEASPKPVSPSPQALALTKAAPVLKRTDQPPTSPVLKEASPTPVVPSPEVAPPTRVLPSRQTKEASNMFEKFDKNNDGKVTLNEFISWREMQFNRLDANNDGSLSRYEVSAGRNKFAQKLAEHFDLIDTNRDQSLSREEFREASRRRFLMLDANRDNNLNTEEFGNSLNPRMGSQ
jgi:class 3 adenylate cyclase/Ca2+-binding EF-hand superfamily protein